MSRACRQDQEGGPGDPSERSIRSSRRAIQRLAGGGRGAPSSSSCRRGEKRALPTAHPRPASTCPAAQTLCAGVSLTGERAASSSPPFTCLGPVKTTPPGCAAATPPERPLLATLPAGASGLFVPWCEAVACGRGSPPTPPSSFLSRPQYLIVSASKTGDPRKGAPGEPAAPRGLALAVLACVLPPALLSLAARRSRSSHGATRAPRPSARPCLPLLAPAGFYHYYIDPSDPSGLGCDGSPCFGDFVSRTSRRGRAPPPSVRRAPARVSVRTPASLTP